MSMSSHIFTYGSLMFPQVWERVVRGHYRNTRAVLAGHVRFAITGETYPGMVAQEGAQVEGVIYFDVAHEDMAALDAFEGIDYRRDKVTVITETGESIAAHTYIYLLPQCFSGALWRPEEFQMERFIGTYCAARLNS